ncbi:hypothetical protein D3C77_614130 [compost metagenome]
MGFHEPAPDLIAELRNQHPPLPDVYPPREVQPAHSTTREIDTLQVAGEQLVGNTQADGHGMQLLPGIGAVAVECWWCTEADAFSKAQFLNHCRLNAINQRRFFSSRRPCVFVLGDKGREA